jgi:hypothetical protein
MVPTDRVLFEGQGDEDKVITVKAELSIPQAVSGPVFKVFKYCGVQTCC